MPKRDSQSSSSSPRRTPSSSHRSKRRSQAEQQGDGAGSRAASNASSSSVQQPNFSSSDPYAVLGVPRDATFQHIKLSYRKLALKHHPDRQTSETDKKVAHENFVAIGHAYEILGDEGRRREHDEELQQQQQQQQRHQSRGQHGDSRDFGHDSFSSMFNDPFFSSGFGSHNMSSSRSGFHFTDPFELFNQSFAEEMGRHRRHHHSSGGRDPFASDAFFDSGGMVGGSFFGGGGMNQMMSGHFDRMNSMMSQMHSNHNMFGGFNGEQQQMMRSNGNGGGSSYNFSSNSSSMNRGGGHQSVSTSTRTTVVNGVRMTIRERTVVHPDGRVDRHVETIDGDGNDMGRLPSSANHPAIEHDGGRRRSRR